MDVIKQNGCSGRGSSRVVVFLGGLLILLIQSTVLQHFLVDALGWPTVYRGIFYGVLILVSLHWGAGVWRERNLPIPLPLILFYGLCLLSTLSAQVVASQFDTLALFVFGLIAASWCAARVRPVEMLKFIVVVGVFTGLILAKNIYSDGVGSYLTDNFRSSLIDGAFQHKNHLGRFSVLVIIASVLCAAYCRKKLVILVAILYLWVLSQANSVGAIMALLFSIWFILGGAIYTVRRSWLLAFMLLSLFGLGLMIVFSAPLLESLGRNATLTGRTEIWLQLIPALKASPFFGAGFDGFQESIKLKASWIRGLSDAHNGFIELLLVLGVAGMALLVLAVVQLGRRVKAVPLHDRVILLFFVALFLFQNTYETLFFKKFDLYWFLFCYAMCRVHIVYKNDSKT